MAIENKVITASHAYIKDTLSAHEGKGFYYHNLTHTLTVTNHAKLLSNAMGLSDSEKKEIELAALFHDSGIGYDYDNHEDESKKIAHKFLKNKIPKENLTAILGIIDATKVSITPTTIPQMILKDADLSNLGEESYFTVLKKIRKEWKRYKPNNPIKKKAFNLYAINFINNHKYYTEIAQRKWGAKKEENLKILEDMQTDQGKKKKKKDVQIAGMLENNKVGQMIFKTSIRNHLDLSALADSKASTMLSVNTLILTLALPLMLPQINENPILGIPTGILVLTSIISIVIATLVTRPVKMNGYTHRDTLKNGKGDLFFFGNFFNMKFDEYLEGMKITLTSNSNLDESIVRDLFYSGQALGAKFHKLRICYAIFIIGIICTGVGFLTILIKTHV